jgi:signal transduction histidine kinase
MRLSLKAKLTTLISVLVLLVVLTTATLYLSHLTRQALAEVASRGQYVANEVYLQAHTVLAQSRLPAGANPQDFEDLRAAVQSNLAGDPGLASLLDSAIGYTPTLYYVAITDTNNRILVHNDPSEIGQRFTPAPSFRNLTDAGLVRQLRVIYGPPRVYDVTLPLDLGGKPLGAVRVGVSTLFVRNQVTPELRDALALSAVIIVLATFSAGLLSFRILRPLESISRSVDRLASGEAPMRLDRSDEWGILSSKLNLLGEQMRGEKAAFVQLKENLDQLFSQLSDGLLLFDREDRLVLATPAVARFLDVDPARILHGLVAEVFSADNPLHALLREVFRTRQSTGWQALEAPGSAVPHLMLSVQFVEEGGEPVGCLINLRDASTRAQIEDQIDTATKLAALSRLMSGVAHEVKNPLNAMVLQVEILRAKLAGAGEQIAPQLEILDSEIRRLDRVVKTFLDFTRPVQLRPTEASLEALVRDVFVLAEPQARQNNVHLVFEANGALPTLRVDPDLMKQALLNVVLNGCQAMPSGGELRVTPRVTPRHLELEISDQGPGIPPEARGKIFSLFYTTKPGGSGVGLAMSYRILQLHNGSIDYSSEADRGTTFRLTLPRI